MIAVCALTALACEADAEREQQAARVLRAVETLRAASGPDRPRLIEELERCDCADKALCEVKTACAAAYKRLVRADALTADAKRLLDAKPKSAAEKTLTAERILVRAKPELKRCVDLHAAQRRRYGR